MFDADNIDWDTVKLLPYHATDLHHRIQKAVNCKNQLDCIEFEPKEVWARVKDGVTGFNAITSPISITLTGQIKDYLKKFEDTDDMNDNSVDREDMID